MSRLGRYLLGSLAMCMALTSCSKRSWTLIDEDEVRRLLPRYAMLSARLQMYGEADSLRLATYRQFLADEGYSLADWDSSMMYYAKHDMPLYHDFYRLASDTLTRQAELLQKRVDSIAQAEDYRAKYTGYTLDSVNLLRLGAVSYYSGDLVNRAFAFAPSVPYTGVEGELSLRLRGLPKLGREQAWDMELRFHAQDSTSEVERIRIDRSGDYKLKIVTLSGKPVVRVTGFVRGLSPKLKSGTFIWLDSLRFVRRPHDDKAIEPSPQQDLPAEATEVTACNPDAL